MLRWLWEKHSATGKLMGLPVPEAWPGMVQAMLRPCEDCEMTCPASSFEASWSEVRRRLRAVSMLHHAIHLALAVMSQAVVALREARRSRRIIIRRIIIIIRSSRRQHPEKQPKAKMLKEKGAHGEAAQGEEARG